MLSDSDTSIVESPFKVAHDKVVSDNKQSEFVSRKRKLDIVLPSNALDVPADSHNIETGNSRTPTTKDKPSGK